MNRTAFKTTEFWITLAAVVASFITTVTELLPAQYGALAAAIAAVLYTGSRTATKYLGDLRRGYRTTEFWISVATIVAVSIAAWQSELTAQAALVINAAIAGFVALSRGMVKSAAGS